MNTRRKKSCSYFLRSISVVYADITLYQRVICSNIFWHSCFSGITNQQKASFIVMAVIILNNSIVTIII